MVSYSFVLIDNLVSLFELLLQIGAVSVENEKSMIITFTKYEVEKFNGLNVFITFVYLKKLMIKRWM